MADRVAKHFCLFVFFLFLLSPVLAYLASTAATEEYDEAVAYYEGHIRSYPDSPQRAQWEGQIRAIRIQQALGAAKWALIFVLAYLVTYGALKGVYLIWRTNGLGLQFWLPRLIAGWVGWMVVALVVTLVLKDALPAISEGRFDPFQVALPPQQSEDYWQTIADRSARPSPERDHAVRAMGAIRAERVRRWTVWFEVVNGLFAVVVIGWIALESRRRRHDIGGPGVHATPISWGNSP